VGRADCGAVFIQKIETIGRHVLAPFNAVGGVRIK
jgi:hypothetical protein